MIHLLFLFFTIITAVVILLLYLKECNKKTAPKSKAPETRKHLKSCILCGSSLPKGRGIRSSEMKRKDDSIVHIKGCDFCLSDKKLIRICPVCKREVSRKEYLIGRMWLREKTGKRHLHVSGCLKCARIKQ